MHDQPASSQERLRLRISVTGTVQGIGFRPFVYRLARDLGLSGWVRNESDRVAMEVEGKAAAVRMFEDRLRHEFPAWACYETFQAEHIPLGGSAERSAESGFEVRESLAAGDPAPTIPPDLAVCPECLRELEDPHDRRYRYPFTNCTQCGPRWSIVEGVPYDRPLTAMRHFSMCPDCRKEYEDPGDRRFHAQPIACPRCGPRLSLCDPHGNVLAEEDAALREAAGRVLEGRILAMKGLGGFQLICDATDERAVGELRRRKRRPDKPFALLVDELMAERYCRLATDAVRRLLRSAAAPIVLLRKREGESPRPPIAESVAPDNPYLGVMLPATPLHYLLLRAVERPLVCTSGNLSEEPMAIENQEALERLGGIADDFLLHDRPIVRPVDDSVVLADALGTCILRRARGFAPRPIPLREPLPVMLALGGHLKNAPALAMGPRVVLGSHVGDLDTPAALRAFRRSVEDLLRFFQAAPELLVCDLHPDYASTRFAEELSGRLRVPLLRVPHHEAHFAACLAENEGLHGEAAPELPVLGAVWDGTGYGTDGTSWGGEFFLFDGRGMRRVAHFATFALPGGDAAARQPRRSALGCLYELLGSEAAGPLGHLFQPGEARVLTRLLAGGTLCPRTSSAGRLFDAAAALLGLGETASFQGQPAMRLQFAAEEFREAYHKEHRGADPADAAQPLAPCRIRPAEEAPDAEPWIVDWRPLFDSLLRAREDRLPAATLAFAFHARLAQTATEVARRFGCRTVALSGGCFQNSLLRELTGRLADQDGLKLLVHREIPPSDGGLALGQIWLAGLRQRAADRSPNPNG
ncbi:MAG: carbamoyltransferase HypF [Thermogutta sp.]|nr:carbamoyltransferase HypF [Thermogutta sp.]